MQDMMLPGRRRYTRRVFLGMSAAGFLGARRWASGAEVSSEPPAPFTIAAINDLHIKDVPSVSIVKRAVEQINRDRRIRCVVVLGDIATDGKAEELRLAHGVLGGLQCPWHALSGNHDITPRSADGYANYREYFGPTHWRQEFEEWVFLGFDSCEGIKSDVYVAASELQWLRAEAENIDARRPIALCCHHPLNPNTRKYRIRNADEVLGIFSRRHLRLCLAGHWHGNQVEEQSGILFCTTACCASTRGNFDQTSARGYRLIHIDGHAFSTEFAEVPLDPISSGHQTSGLG